METQKQEVENELVIRPLTPERRHQASHDVPVVMEMLSSTQRDLDGGLIQSDLIQTTRLSMLRELLQGDTSQEQEVSDVQRQHYRTTISAPLPVWRSPLQVEQVEQEKEVQQVTGDEMQTELTSDLKSDIISLTPSVSYPGLPARLFLKMRDACSAPSSPHPRGRRRLPCSLPCSPLLGGRRWRSSDSAPSLPSPLSRLWVEAALQRSRNIRPPPPPSPQVGQEGQVEGGTEEESEEEEEEEEEDNQVIVVGIRMSDTDSETWRYCLLSPCVCSRCPSAPPYEGQVFSPGNSRTDPSLRSEDQTQLCQRTDTLRTDTQRTETQRTDTQRTETQRTETQRTDTQRTDTQRTDTQRTDTKRTETQRTNTQRTDTKRTETQRTNTQRTDTQRTETQRTNTQRTDTQRTDTKRTETQRTNTQRTDIQSVPADRAPQQGESSRLYPSLSQWRITADAQTELNRKQEVNCFNCQLDTNTAQSCFHGNTDDHLQRVCETTSGSPGDVWTFCSDDLNFFLRKVFDSTTCSRTTVRYVESCSFCSDTLSDRVTKHLCNNCHQVFCGRCLSHFVSLLQIHQFSQTVAV
ncbi:uncharacterized protein LOC126389092 [Epinephelus moara]|uniref:uncharacterized protein LOC126389092 n=1 Tax=Epinephelus moara TaxID=300413 RepID=UPI00214EC506|nr:uncharacterized protein LOC126389092 [Epinephelus moara]